MLKFDDLAREVEQSGLFDADWYVQNFPDARLVDVTPLQHFVRFGLLVIMPKKIGPWDFAFLITLEW